MCFGRRSTLRPLASPFFPGSPAAGGPFRLRLAGFTSGVLLSGRGNRGPSEEAFGEDFRGFRRNFAGGGGEAPRRFERTARFFGGDGGEQNKKKIREVFEKTKKHACFWRCEKSIVLK